MYQATEKCPKCGNPNLRGNWVCAKCGQTLQVFCPNCKASNAAGSKFCQSCGMPLSGAAGSQPMRQSPPQQPVQPYPPAPQQGYQQPVQPYQQPGQYQQEYPQQAQPYQQPGQYQQGYQQPAQSSKKKLWFKKQEPQQYDPYQQPQYDPNQQYPPQYDGYWKVDKKYPAYGSWQDKFDRVTENVKQFIRETNPVLLSALVIGVVGMIIFMVLAFQLGWIKTGDASTATSTSATDKTGPQLSMVQLKDGTVKNSVIVSWITDEYSSSRVSYGTYPYRNSWTLITNDPTTGTNKGVLIHEVLITNLIGGSTYVYCVESKDKYGNVTLGPEMQFQTSKQ